MCFKVCQSFKLIASCSLKVIHVEKLAKLSKLFLQRKKRTVSPLQTLLSIQYIPCSLCINAFLAFLFHKAFQSRTRNCSLAIMLHYVKIPKQTVTESQLKDISATYYKLLQMCVLCHNCKSFFFSIRTAGKHAANYLLGSQEQLLKKKFFNYRKGLATIK